MSQSWKWLVWALAGAVVFMFMGLLVDEQDIRRLQREVAELRGMSGAEAEAAHVDSSGALKVDGYVDGTPGQGSYMPKVQGVNPVQTKDLMFPEDMQGVLLVKIVGDERVWEMRPRVRKR